MGEGPGVRSFRAGIDAVPSSSLSPRSIALDSEPARDSRPIIPRSVARAEPIPLWHDDDRHDHSPRPDSPRAEVRAAVRSDGRPAPAAETTVRVTIGRIEVRATAPAPAPAPAARPTGPRLTLDEYLRRRREGRM
jgi:hypothetical protein